MLHDTEPLSTYIIVEQVAGTLRVIAYVKQCTEREIRETRAQDSVLTLFELAPETPPFSLYGGWRLRELLRLEATDTIRVKTQELGNELRRLRKDQAMLELDTIETRLRKAVAECAVPIAVSQG